MELLLKTYRSLSPGDKDEIYRNGKIVFDTNVLLKLYRYAESTREDWFKTLGDDNVKDRIWIPFQVLLEFTARLEAELERDQNNLTKLEEIYGNVISVLESQKAEFAESIRILKLSEQRTVIEADKAMPDDFLEQSIKEIQDRIIWIEELKKIETRSDEELAIQNRVIELFTGQTGECLPADKLAEIYADGEKRYAENIPPGFKDIKKTETRMFKGVKILNKYADLIIWNEIIEKAKIDDWKSILFVTDDSAKDDWFRKAPGNLKSPRLELLDEIYSKVPGVEMFHMTTSEQFLKFITQTFNIQIESSSIVESGKPFVETNDQKAVNLEDAPVVSDMIQTALRDVSLELKLVPVELPHYLRHLYEYTIFPYAGTKVIKARRWQDFSNTLKSTFNLFYTYSADKNVYFELEWAITGFWTYTFSTYIDQSFDSEELKRMGDSLIGYYNPKSGQRAFIIEPDQIPPYKFTKNRLAVGWTFSYNEFEVFS